MSWLSLTFSQVAPASSDLYRAASSDSTVAHTRPDLAGDAAIPMRPFRP